MSRRFTHSSCSFSADLRWKGRKPCKGPIVMIGTIGLCPKHLRLLDAIVADSKALRKRPEWRISA